MDRKNRLSVILYNFGEPSMAKSFSIALWCLFAAVLISPAKAENSKACEKDKAAVAKNFITRNGSVLMDGDKEFRFFALASSNLHQNEEQILPG